MRIVYVLTSLGVGGAERLTITLAREMTRRGHTVALLVLRPRLPGDLHCEVPTVHLGMNKKPLRVMAGLLKALRFLEDFHADVLHSHSFHANIVARGLGFLTGKRVIATIHNVWEGGEQRMLAYRLTDGIGWRTVAVSSAVADRFVQQRAVAKDKCAVIRNAIDLNEFEPDAETRARTRADMGVSGEFVWLSVGRNAPAKDYGTVLRGFERVKAAYPQTQLWIAGANFPEQEPLRNLAERYGLSAAVRWLGMRNDVAALLGAADAFVMGSAWEGMPLALAEAMAMKKPVVATDVGGVRELVGQAGILAPPHDTEMLTEAMIEVMSLSQDERMTMGNSARKRIAKEFGMETRIEEWEQLYAAAVAH